MSELLPCPFCGGEAITIQEHGWWVVCTDCSAEVGFEGMSDTSGCYGSYQTEAEAIAAWNTRAERTCERDGDEFNVTLVRPDGFCAWGERSDFVTCKCGEDIERIGRIQTCPSCGRSVMA